MVEQPRDIAQKIYDEFMVKNPPPDESKDPMANLMVNNIDHEVSDEVVRALFDQQGEMVEFKLILDKLTNRRKGFGFVRYISPTVAKNAIAALHGYTLGTKVLRVAVAQPPTEEESYANLYVAGLNPIWNQDQITEFFSVCGEVAHVHVLTDKGTGTARGVAFVRYVNKNSAMNAIAAFNDAFLPNNPKSLAVRFAIQKPADGIGPNRITNPALAQHRYNPMAGRPDNRMGYGYPQMMQGGYGAMPTAGYQPMMGGAEYMMPNAAVPAQPGVAPPAPATATNGGTAGAAQAYSAVGGYPPAVGAAGSYPPAAGNVTANTAGQYGPAQPAQMLSAPRPMMATQPPVATPPAVLFVYNLPPESTEPYVQQLFQSYGPISNVRVMRDPNTQMCKGYAFVSFVRSEDAANAISAMNGAQLGDKFLQVSFKRGS